jgi:hypothetical protein
LALDATNFLDMHRLINFAVAISLVTAASGCRPDTRSNVRSRSAEVTAAATDEANIALAQSTVAQYLEAVREGHQGSSAIADSLRGCQMADGMYQPIEVLASYRLLGRPTMSADTVTVRAEVITVAEEDGSPSTLDRFVAVQRVRRDTVTYQLTSDSTVRRWVLCTGPQYGRWGSDAKTDWRPRGASGITARTLADSVWEAEHRSASRPGV